MECGQITLAGRPAYFGPHGLTAGGDIVADLSASPTVAVGSNTRSLHTFCRTLTDLETGTLDNCPYSPSVSAAGVQEVGGPEILAYERDDLSAGRGGFLRGNKADRGS